jgi:hypothetical protein
MTKDIQIYYPTAGAYNNISPAQLENTMKKEYTAADTFDRLKRTPLDFKEVDFSSFELEGIDWQHHPDFCDAFISDAAFLNGRMLSDDELDELNNDRDIVYEAVLADLY